MAVRRAREAARWWGGLGWPERRDRLLDWKSFLTRHMDELAELMHEETGSPPTMRPLNIVLADRCTSTGAPGTPGRRWGRTGC